MSLLILLYRLHFKKIVTPNNLLAQEVEIISLAAATLVSKYRKIATFDELLERTFFLGKAAIAALLFFIGIPHMVSYLILWTGVFVVSALTVNVSVAHIHVITITITIAIILGAGAYYT